MNHDRERPPWERPEEPGLSPGGKWIVGGLLGAVLLLIPLLVVAFSAVGVSPAEMTTATVGAVKNVGVVAGAVWAGGVPTDWQSLVRKTTQGRLSPDERRRVQAYGQALGLSPGFIDDARSGRLTASDERKLLELAADFGLAPTRGRMSSGY